MNWQLSPYSVPLIVGAAILVLSAFIILRRATTPTGTYLAITNILIAIFSGSYGVELSQTSLEWVFFWKKMGFLGGAAAPVFLLLVIVAFNGSERWLTRVNHLLLLAIPALSTGLAWTSPDHGLIWNHPKLIQTGTLFVLEYNPGWWYWVSMSYAYLMIVLGVVYLLVSFNRREGSFRKQVILFLAGISIPMLAFGFVSVLAATVLSLPKIEWHAYALIITGLMVAVSFLNYPVFQIGPVAYDTIYKNLEDVIVILDSQNRVIDVNPAAARILNWERLDVIGKALSEAFSPSELETLRPCLDDPEAQGEIVLGEYHLDLKITSFRYQQKKSIGRLMVMRDVSRRVKAEQVLENLVSLDLLTPRQWEVLNQVAEGYTYKEVGERLFISERTVKYHMGQILSALNLDNWRAAIRYIKDRQDQQKMWSDPD